MPTTSMYIKMLLNKKKNIYTLLSTVSGINLDNQNEDLPASSWDSSFWLGVFREWEQHSLGLLHLCSFLEMLGNGYNLAIYTQCFSVSSMPLRNLLLTKILNTNILWGFLGNQGSRRLSDLNKGLLRIMRLGPKLE